jgi:uncharacterized membrane protein
VFFVIVPNHWKLVRASEAGERPDPRWNRAGKTRSVQRLPHAPRRVRDAVEPLHHPDGHWQGWLILVALTAIGALIRHYFTLHHGGVNVWPMLLVAGAELVAVALAAR